MILRVHWIYAYLGGYCRVNNVVFQHMNRTLFLFIYVFNFFQQYFIIFSVPVLYFLKLIQLSLLLLFWCSRWGTNSQPLAKFVILFVATLRAVVFLILLLYCLLVVNRNITYFCVLILYCAILTWLGLLVLIVFCEFFQIFYNAICE